jgi:hypothetical protein
MTNKLTQAVDSNLVLVDEDIPQLMLANDFIPVAVINGTLCKVTWFLEFVCGLVLKK